MFILHILSNLSDSVHSKIYYYTLTYIINLLINQKKIKKSNTASFLVGSKSSRYLGRWVSKIKN